VKEILTRLENGALEAANEAVWIYLVAYQVLQAAGDPAAGKTLERGYLFLSERAKDIADEALRQAYLQNIPANRELLAAWDALRSA
jgi:hypothetical protein